MVVKKVLMGLIVAWGCARGVMGLCSTGCSGHGTCGDHDKCACFSGFWGSDCSFQHCPNGTTWVGKASSQNNNGVSAHTTLSECSRAGICELNTGTCRCFAGFEGSACDRLSCNRNCRGRGICMTMRQMGEFVGLDGSAGSRGDGVGPLYGSGVTTVWDEDFMRACVCDWGYAGADCVEKLCPAGDNPFTSRQQQRAVTLTIDTMGETIAADGTENLRVTAVGHTSANTIDVGALAAGSLEASDCEALFESLENVDSASCRYTSSGTEHVFDVVLGWEMDQSTFSNFFSHDGNPSLSQFTCDMSTVNSSDVTCGFTDIDVQTLTFVASDNADEIVVEITDDTSSPNQFQYRVGTNAAFIEGNNVTTSAFAMDGSNATIAFASEWGHTTGARWTISTANVITQPGFREYAYCGGVGTCDRNEGICTCHETTTGPACQNLVDEASSATASSVSTLLAEQADYSGAVLRLETQRAKSTDFNFLIAVEGGNSPLFAVGGSGLITGQNMKLLAGMTIQSGGLVLSATGQTIQAGPLILDSGDLLVEAGITTLTTSSSTHTSNALTVTSSSTSFTATVLAIASDRTASSSAYRLIDAYYDAAGSVTRVFEVFGDGTVRADVGPLEVNGGGASITGGLTVTSSGSTITQDSSSTTALLVEASSVSYTDDVLIATADTTSSTAFGLLTLKTGLGASTTVFRVRGDGQLRVYQGGILVDSGGLEVTAGGVTVSAVGIDVTGGVTTDSFTVSAGPSEIEDGGLLVTDGGATITSTASSSSRVLVLQATSTSMDSTDRVLEIRSDTDDTAGHALLWAGAENGGSVTERFKVESDGDVFVHGDLDVDTGSAITGIIGTASALEGRFNPLKMWHAATLVPSVQLAGEWSTLDEESCGGVYFAGSTNAERSTGTYLGVVIELPETTNGADTTACMITVVIRASDHPVYIRSASDGGALYGHMLTHSGATVSYASISTSSFGNSIGTDQLERSAGGDDYDYIQLIADPLTGTNYWYIMGGFGDWSITSQGLWV